MSTSNSLAVPQADLDPNWAQGSIQPPYVPLSLIHAPLAERGASTDLTKEPLDSLASSVSFKDKSALLPQYKATWGAMKELPSRRHADSGISKSKRQPSRRKEKIQASSPKGSSASGSLDGHQLRSTRTGQKTSSHNKAEKKYRTRLNSRLSTLLEVLPLELVGAEVEGYKKDDPGAGEKKVSKGEVLALAKRHIRDLERENQALKDRNNLLSEGIQNLKTAWIMGGRVLP
jgi:Helix-loop-helix DNA-binding domain